MKPKPKSINEIPSGLVARTVERLAQGQRVRRTLPGHGRIHIDRTLPFLVVYRRPPHHIDPGTERLVKGEASYLIASGTRSLHAGLSDLVRGVVGTLAAECESFLIIEIWSAPKLARNENLAEISVKPGFRIVTAPSFSPSKTVDALEIALKRIKILKHSSHVEVIYEKHTHPPGLPSLVSVNEARLMNCFVLGLEIQPIFHRAEPEDILPLVLRTLHRRLSVALKRAAFEFARQRTPRRPSNYQALGRRAFVKAVWKVDHQLAQITQSFDFLLQVTPINVDSAWSQFKKSRYKQAPVFYYRPSPMDPALVKRHLYQIPIERIEDPTLAFVFREKRIELDRQLTMLLDRGKPQFLYGGLQLFGDVSDSLLHLAQRILTELPRRNRDESPEQVLTPKMFAALAEREIEGYRHVIPDISSNVQIRDDVTGIMVSQGNVLISKSAQLSASRAQALLQHEVGTHVLTHCNGLAQPFKQLCCGLAGYEGLQEGLAVMAEYLVGGLGRPRLRLLAGRALAVHRMISGASFVDVYTELNQDSGFKQRVAFGIAVRVFRGGGLTKDVVYLQGLVELLDYLRSGGDLGLLYIGKVSMEHIPIIRELLSRKVLQAAPLRPEYLDSPEAVARLDKARQGISPLDLVKRRK
jgi:uncharacterized protein (TIGR02421 family)